MKYHIAFHSFCIFAYISLTSVLTYLYPSKANAIGGRNEKAVREFLEKSWVAGASEEDSVRLTIRALLEVVDSGSKNMEVAVMRKGQEVSMVSDEKLEAVIKDIEREQEEAKAKSQSDATQDS